MRKGKREGKRKEDLMWKNQKVNSTDDPRVGTANGATESEDDQEQGRARRSKRQIICLKYRQVVAMTNNFDMSLHVGKGAFGDVFKGDTTLVGMSHALPAVVAVKRDKRKEASLGPSSTAAEKKDKAATDRANKLELDICSTYSHRYLCNLVGTCLDGPHRCLLFEFCPGGDLFNRLHPELLPPHKRKPLLTAGQRLGIVAYAAQGLEYLHCAAIPPVLHRDLLRLFSSVIHRSTTAQDHELEGSVCSFGLKKFF